MHLYEALINSKNAQATLNNMCEALSLGVIANETKHYETHSTKKKERERERETNAQYLAIDN